MSAHRLTNSAPRLPLTLLHSIHKSLVPRVLLSTPEVPQMSVLGILSSGVLLSLLPKFSHHTAAQDFQKLGQDLQSADLSASRKDLSSLQKDLPTSTLFAPNSLAQHFSQLRQALQSNNLPVAQQAYSCLQQDLQQLTSSSTSPPNPTSLSA
jgi:hypothetical protein